MSRQGRQLQTTISDGQINIMTERCLKYEIDSQQKDLASYGCRRESACTPRKKEFIRFRGRVIFM
jgi:hypothetical protein